MKVAQFAGIIDVPIFSAPDLGLTGYVGFDASPQFSPHIRAPLFSYQPQAMSTDPTVLGRVVSLMPNLTGHSVVTKNPTVVPGFSGMSFRATWIDGSTYLLNALPASGTNYPWRLFRYPQTRVPGASSVVSPAQFAIDSGNPFTAFGLPRIEFTHPPLPGYDWSSLQNLPQLIFNQNNTYNAVFALVLTDMGLRVRNAFNAVNIPGATWLNTLSGSTTAFCRNAQANSNFFGLENRPSAGAAFGLGFHNYMYVSKGLKSNALVMNWRLTEYSPTTLGSDEPRWDYVTFDDAYYTNLLATSKPHGYKDGFIFVVKTDGGGKTGQLQEVIVTDPIFNQYYILRFVPQNTVAEQAMKTTTTTWSVMIDTEGTVWFYNGGSPGFKDAVFNSWSPALFFNPRLIDFDLPAVVMPCYNTCMPGYF